MFLESAVHYTQVGWRVFPCQPRGKKPLIKNWPERATTDLEKVRNWWSCWPDANVAVVTGNGLGVLDVDCDKDDFRNIRTLLKLMVIPSIAIAITGTGGIHYYIADDFGMRNKVNMLPGLDWRGEGGYVIAPPSIHPNGEEYLWRKEPIIKS